MQRRRGLRRDGPGARRFAAQRSQLDRGKPLQRTQMRRSSSTSSRVPVDVADVVRRRSGGRCEAQTSVCVGPGEHLHHRRMRSQGGDDTPANLLHVCHACHGEIHARPAVAYERGWLLRTST